MKMSEKRDEIKAIIPHPGKPRSHVWQDFGFYENEKGEVDMTVAVCKLCRRTYAHKGNTSNLLKHMEMSHPEKNTPQSTPLQSSTSSITKYFPTSSRTYTPLPKLEQEHHSTNLQKFLVMSMVPLSTVEDPSFKTFIHGLQPRFQVPARKTITERMQSCFKTLREELKIEMQNCNDIGVTHDSWTSCANENYETVTAHYITSDWTLKGRVLETSKISGPHTADAIGNYMSDLKTRWNLPDVTVVTDNASVEVKAFADLNWPRIGCIGHTINLVVKKALSANTVSRIVGRGRSLVSYFHKSPLATGFLQQKQKLVLQKEFQDHKLINDVPTRWNSTYHMLKRLTEQMPALHALAMDQTAKIKNIKSLLYDFEDQKVVEELTAVLQPFDTATTLLSAEASPTLPLVLPSLKKIQKTLKENDDEGRDKTVENILKDLEERMQGHMEYYAIASFLDPRTKELPFMPFAEKIALHESVREILENAYRIKQEPGVKPDPDPEPEPEQQAPALPMLEQASVKVELEEENIVEENKEPATKKPKVSEDWLDDVMIMGEQPAVNKTDAIRLEMDRFLAESSISLQGDPLKWWKQKECLFPNIAKLAKKYLAIPASSVPSERIFSLAGNIVSRKRASLKPENVDMLVFLKKNKYCA